MVGSIRRERKIERLDSLLRIVGRVCYYLKIEHLLYLIGALYCKAICTALDEVFVHYVAPDSVHQLALAVSFDNRCRCYVLRLGRPSAKARLGRGSLDHLMEAEH